MTKGEISRFRFEQLRTVLFAGEVFPVKHLRGVMTAFGQAEFFNLYGPTETNVCTYYPVPRPIPEGLEELPLGEACANIEVFALTDHGAPARIDEEGELLVKGPCVMLGYWGLPQRTAESVIQNPLHSDFLEPVYRTGDRVRVLPEGGFNFLGRLDHMVKVRGYRVELGEIEYAFREHPGIRDAAVVALPDEEVGARLAAVLVLADGVAMSSDDASRHCLNRLPRHAVPEIVIFMEELPMTSNGKVDRVTLKDLLGSDARAPTTITT
jgi:acyl-coenzyme A synthetase/AMP-(fatty) acid ligase